jgi:16S rRNA (adenine1518-N6/adenine1519-N6)-dimethyltransferase
MPKRPSVASPRVRSEEASPRRYHFSVTHSRSEIKRLLDAHGLRPARALGQNFVADPNTVRRIVRLAGVAPGTPVLEIGAGLGSLTLGLAEAGGRVVAVEADLRLLPALREVLSGTDVEVVGADALVLDFDTLLGQGGQSEGWRVVANLPYNLATPMVIRLLEEATSVRSLLVMVQREVGERLAAGPGDAAYGAVSVKVAYWATAAVVGRVPPTVFVPRPKVESALVRIERRSVPAIDPARVAYERLFQVVRAGFAQRRKMLRRSLAGLVDERDFAGAGVDPRARAEDLSIEQWGALAESRSRCRASR